MIVKAPLRFIRVRHLELRSYCPTKKKLKEKMINSTGLVKSRVISFPSVCLPLVVAFIFIVSMLYLVVIHQTIKSYKLRNQAFEDCYFPMNSNDSKTVQDLAFAQNFLSAWPSGNGNDAHRPGVGSRGDRYHEHSSYPYNLRRRHVVEHDAWKPSCPENPPDLKGNISIDFRQDLDLETIFKSNIQVEPGGKWWPPDCVAKLRVAIIIPFRDRWKHLLTLLSILHPMIRRQLLSYKIFIAEQFGNYTFNKGVLNNAAFILALNESAFDCVIFHDVDLIPEDDRNLYTCSLKQPRHLSVSVDALRYRLPYASLVGGVISVHVEDFIQVNGFSNVFWGWGAEDDDFSNRLLATHLPIFRPNPSIARYKMLSHGRRTPNKFIAPLIRTSKIRFRKDGLTSCQFRLLKMKEEPLFTHMVFDVGTELWKIENKTIKLTDDLRLPEKYL